MSTPEEVRAQIEGITSAIISDPVRSSIPDPDKIKASILRAAGKNPAGLTTEDLDRALDELGIVIGPSAPSREDIEAAERADLLLGRHVEYPDGRPAPAEVNRQLIASASPPPARP